MKKNYNEKKKAVIVALSFVVVCLAGGLFYYINTIGSQPQEVMIESISPSPSQSEVKVPEIETTAEKIQSNTEDVPAAVLSSEDTDEEKSDAKNEANTVPSVNETQSQKKTKPSDGKPKSPNEATPPAEPPTKNETTVSTEKTNDEKQSPTENTPQPETKQESTTSSPNSVYVPGFGNIEPSGTVEGKTSHTDGDWEKQIGEMK